MEDYATVSPSNKAKTSTSLNNNSDFEMHTESLAMETRQPKDGVSDARKGTKNERSASKTGSKLTDSVDDNFDWFDDIGDEEEVSDTALYDSIRSQEAQSESKCTAVTEPSAKRQRR